jgi:hypothetical protein
MTLANYILKLLLYISIVLRGITSFFNHASLRGRICLHSVTIGNPIHTFLNDQTIVTQPFI